MLKNLTLKHFLIFEMCAREICEKFVYKHSEATDMLKISLLFRLHGQITR